MQLSLELCIHLVYLKEIKLAEIFDKKKEIQICYDELKSCIDKVIINNTTIIKNKNPRRVIRQLVKQKRILKKKMKQVNRSQRKILVTAVKTIEERLNQENNKQFETKINKVVEKLKCEKGIHGPSVWEVMRKVKQKKNDPPTAVLDNEGNIIEEAEAIKDRYLEHFTSILKPPAAENEEESSQEKIIDIAFQNISLSLQKQEVTKTTASELDEAINELKKNKCKDEEGWCNEIIINGGDEVKQSLLKLFNRMESEKTLPKQWNDVMIKTIPKTGTVLDMNNKRGIFITNIISKIYEKILKNRNSAAINKYTSEYQTGGIKGRSTIDNIYILSETIRWNKKIGKKTYVVFGDAVKCFDKLWLKDSLVATHKIYT